MASEGQAVRFRDCTCPGTPHNGRDGADDGDIVIMRDHLGFAAGAEALRKMAATEGNVELFGELVGPVYIREGPLAWNLVGDTGPIPLSKAALDELPFHEAYLIAEKGDDLYALEVLSPLAKRMNGHSGTGQIAPSTPRSTRSSGTRHSPRKPSSPVTSASTPAEA